MSDFGNLWLEIRRYSQQDVRIRDLKKLIKTITN